jgi:predicted membrane-bound spermidine synthase
VLVLVAVPVTLLGAAAPWAVRLAVGEVGSSGEVVGRLYAISTAGSLLGTMISALLLIPLLGTQRTFLVFALALALVAMVGIGARAAVVPVCLLAFLAVPVGTIKADADGRVFYEAETTHQYARVTERDDGTRVLELNEGQAVHSLYRPGSYLTGDYWDGHLVLPAAAAARPPRRIAILGNAGGTVARSFGHFFPRTVVDAVAGEGSFSAARLRAHLRFLPRALRAEAELASRGLEPRMPGGEVYTDDRAPVEWLVDSSLLEYANE